jgi:trimeric autotransporter adhesin
MKKLLLIAYSFTFAILVSHAQLPGYIPANGLAAWYSFNGNALDGSGHGNDGTVQNALLCSDRNDFSASAYYFGGGNRQILCPNDTSITNSKNFTASVWFKVENRPSGWQQNVMVSNIGTWMASGGFEIYTGNPPNTDITVMFRNNTHVDQSLSTTGLVNIDSALWYHVVYTLQYNSSEDSTLASVFLNANLIKTQKFYSHIDYSFITPFLVGVNIDSIGWQRAFKGRIDDIGLWNRALNQSEINHLYSANVGIEYLSARDESNIYPNPSRGEINIRCNNFQIDKIEIYDVSGNKIQSVSCNHADNYQIHSNLAKGEYFIRIFSGLKTKTQKLMIE